MSLLRSGAGRPIDAASVSFTGAGDIISGALAWWGLRAYNAAYATGSNPAIDIVKTSDGSALQTINILSTGALDTATISGLGYGVSVTKLYDQTGNGNHLTQATLANMPVLTLNSIGVLPAMTFVRTSDQGLSTTTGIAFSQPHSISHVSKRTSGAAGWGTVVSFGDASVVVGYEDPFSGTTSLTLYASATFVTVSAADNSTHAIQLLGSGASSIIYVDGSSNVVSAGTLGSASGTYTRAITLGEYNGVDGHDGTIHETGVWSGDKSGLFSSINSNQHAYWGF